MILGTYLSGANSRRIRRALKPLLGEEHLSKSAVSRVVSRLKERFEEWQSRDLSDEVYAIVYLDGFHLKVRMAKRVISVPVLAALGVAPDGQKRLLSLRLAVSESSTHWGSALEGLQARGLRAPKLVISDGHKGLTKALEKWPECRLQRCTEHKRANLLEHCPAHARRELRRDYNRIVYSKNGIDARKAYDKLVAKWTPLAPGRRPKPRGGRQSAADLLRIPSCHVEIDSHDQCSGESQPRVSTPDENPSVVLQRGVRGRFAVWAYRLWPDSTATHRRLPTSERGSRTRGGCRLI